MLESLNDYLQAVYLGNKYIYSLLVLLVSIVFTFTAESLARIPSAWTRTATANRRKGSPRWQNPYL